jgi:hypothetical protein
MDSDVGKDFMMPIPSSMEVGDCHPKCNNFVVLDNLPLEWEQLAFQVTNPEEDECIKSPTGKVLDTRHSIQYS